MTQGKYNNKDTENSLLKTDASHEGKIEKFQNLLKKLDMCEENVIDYIKGNYKDSEYRRAPERCFLLYEKGMIKNELMRTLQEKNNQIRDQQQMVECTFKPVINNSYKNKLGKCVLGNEDKSKIYTRNTNKQKQFNEK